MAWYWHQCSAGFIMTTDESREARCFGPIGEVASKGRGTANLSRNCASPWIRTHQLFEGSEKPVEVIAIRPAGWRDTE